MNKVIKITINYDIIEEEIDINIATCDYKKYQVIPLYFKNYNLSMLINKSIQKKQDNKNSYAITICGSSNKQYEIYGDIYLINEKDGEFTNFDKKEWLNFRKKLFYESDSD